MQIIRRNSWWLLENRAIFYLVFISACLFESVVVVFIPLYTLAGFYIPPPPQCFPLISIYNFHISKISLLSFSIYHIFHIFHCLDRFPGSSFPMSSLPASPRYFFQSVSNCVSCPAVITFSQFAASYFSRIFFLPDVTLQIFLSSWLFLCFPFPTFLRIHIVFSQFTATYFTYVMYTFFLFVFSSFLFVQFLFFLSIVSEFPYHLLILGIPFKMLSFPNSPSIPSLLILSHPLFAISFQAASFSCFFFLASGSACWRPLIVVTRYYSIGYPPSSSLFLPLAANFIFCQSSLTFPSTLYFSKLQFIITFSRFPIIYL